MSAHAEQECVVNINRIENAAFEIWPNLKTSILWSICKNESSFRTYFVDESRKDINIESIDNPWIKIKEIVNEIDEIFDYYKFGPAFGRANLSLFNPHRHLVPSCSQFTFTLFRENTTNSVSKFYQVDREYRKDEWELRKDENKTIIDLINFNERDIYSISGMVWHDWITEFSEDNRIFTPVSIWVLRNAKTIKQRDIIIDYLESI